MKKVILLFLIMVLITPVFAETIYLKDGSVMEGKTIRTEGDFIFFKTKYAEMKIDKNEIQKVLYDEKLKEPNISPISTATDALTRYKLEEKNAGFGFLGWLICPSLGHGLVGNWQRGVIFLGIDVLAAIAMTSTNTVRHYYHGYYYTTEPSKYAKVGAAIFIISRLWELLDVVSYCNDYNKKLKEKYGLSIAPIIYPDKLGMACNIKL